MHDAISTIVLINNQGSKKSGCSPGKVDFLAGQVTFYDYLCPMVKIPGKFL